MKQYKRDKRSPSPSSALSSRIMSSIRAKNTSPEIIFRKHLYNVGLRGFRIHYKIPGRPDVVFTRHKIAIFINGCYWHRCPNCRLPIPKSNTNFWQEKFVKNVERDKAKKHHLEAEGWKVFIVWECEVKQGEETAIKAIEKVIKGC